MTCSCPKCAAKIELDIQQIPEDGTTITCPGCKASFQITHESVARRAYRKPDETHCIKCGNHLGNSVHCPACGTAFADYFVAETPEEARKRAKKSAEALRSLKNSSFEWKIKPAPSPRYQYTPRRPTPRVTEKPQKKSPRLALAVISLIVVVASAAAGYTMYSHSQARRQYAEVYFKALYAIKAGTDLNLKSCTRIADSWQASLNTGQNFAPRLTPQEEARLPEVKTQADKLILKLQEPPAKYAQSKEKLDKLNGIYSRSYALAFSRPASLANFSDSVNKVESDFKQTSQELKSTLPEELKEELQSATAKYRALRDF